MKGKNYKGGYKIISLLGASLIVGATIVIPGIHKAIESSYRKPLLIEGIVVDGVEKDATWVKELKVVEGSFVIEIYGLKLTITDEDEVSVEEIVEPQSSGTKLYLHHVNLFDEDEADDRDIYLVSSTKDEYVNFDDMMGDINSHAAISIRYYVREANFKIISYDGEHFSIDFENGVSVVETVTFKGDTVTEL